MYLRDDASRYDSGIISGHAMLELTAGDKIALAVRRLDAQYSDATYVHPAETRLLIERIDYELVRDFRSINLNPLFQIDGNFGHMVAHVADFVNDLLKGESRFQTGRLDRGI